MNRMMPFILGGFLVMAIAACDNNAKTSSNAPNSTDKNGQVASTQTAQTNKNDATNEIRKKQLEADIRAREERNKVAGNPQERADGDLESEVRDKLEANMPVSQLTVDAKDGVVTVSGSVPKQDQLSKISPLAKEIKGVKSVDVKATVAPAQPN